MASNFRIPHLFVVPVSNTIPTSGTTAALTSGQVGTYRADYTVATAGNAAAAALADGIQIFQGNHVAIPYMGNKRSDHIVTKNVTQWYKVPAQTTATPQITTVTGLSVQAGENINITLRLDSNLISNAYFNGLMKTVSVSAACADCGDDPCTDLVADSTYTDLRDAINADALLSQYITATVTGTVVGSNATLVLTGKTLVNPFPTSSDPHNDPFRFNALRFFTYVSKGPETSQDFEIYDRCDIPGAVTVTQRATYKHGTAAEVKQMEKDYYSYMYPQYKTLFQDSDYNGAFSSQVTAANYDMFYLKYLPDEIQSTTAPTPIQESAIIAIPTGEGSDLIAVLTAAFGAPKNKVNTADAVFSPLVP